MLEKRAEKRRNTDLELYMMKSNSFHQLFLRRWFLLKDTFLAYMDEDKKKFRGLLLFDGSISITHERMRHTLVISNQSRRSVCNVILYSQHKKLKNESYQHFQKMKNIIKTTENGLKVG